MPELLMPRLSDSMEEGTILTWFKRVGDRIEVGEEVVEIESDKANMAYEADVAGVLTEILAEEGQTLPVGNPIAIVAAAGAKSADEDRAEPEAAPEPEAAAAPAAANVPEPEAAPVPARRPKASPLARRIARERELDLSRVEGSGPGGRILRRDVEKAVGAAPSAPVREGAQTAKGEVAVEELSRMQRVVAQRMAESKAVAPHFYLETTVDVSALVASRDRLKAASPESRPPSFNDMVVKACALALREFPRANGAFRDGRFELYSRVNVGVAVAGEDGLVVPTVFDADRKGLTEIAADTRAMAARAREGSITPPELAGGTFTVSNLGMYGVRAFGAVINPPQAAILAVGTIEARPIVADDGTLRGAEQMDLVLACDHRILYGADAAQFLARIRSLLEVPLSLAL